MAKLPNTVRRLRQSLTMAFLMPVAGFFAGSGLGESNQAEAIEGTELNGSVGIWAPLLPEVAANGGASVGSSDEVGTIIGLRGHHRFDGYRTSVEGGVQYGVNNDVEMFAFDALLRDTWSFSFGDLSAGTGYSQMNWTQDYLTSSIESDYQGAKIVGGWETAFGRQPIWIDLTLGLYDLNGSYTGEDGVGAPVTADISTFTTTWGIDVKADHEICGVPVRAIFGLNYLDDITTWQGGEIGTDNAVVLTGALEFRLF